MKDTDRDDICFKYNMKRIADLENKVEELELEIYGLRLFGNHDCTAQTDEWMKTMRKVKEDGKK